LARQLPRGLLGEVSGGAMADDQELHGLMISCAMGRDFEAFSRLLFRKLDIDDLHYVEIECKKRVEPEESAELKDWLLDRKKIKHKKSAFFFDQFVDTPSNDLLRLGASLRLRYKRGGS